MFFILFFSFNLLSMFLFSYIDFDLDDIVDFILGIGFDLDYILDDFFSIFFFNTISTSFNLDYIFDFVLDNFLISISFDLGYTFDFIFDDFPDFFLDDISYFILDNISEFLFDVILHLQLFLDVVQDLPVPPVPLLRGKPNRVFSSWVNCAHVHNRDRLWP